MIEQTQEAARILVVDDEASITDLLSMALRYEKFDVLAAHSGREALDAVPAFAPDLVVLDVMMPGIDGFEVARRLRNDATPLPILFLTAKDAVSSRLAGFSAGADDYVIKPVAVEELLARLRALLRRSGRLEAEVLEVGDLILDEPARVVRRGDTMLELTPIEFQLLGFLMRNRGVVLSRLQIMSQVWGYEEHDPNLVPVHMGNLRRKLEASGPRLIHTIRGHGYVLRA